MSRQVIFLNHFILLSLVLSAISTQVLAAESFEEVVVTGTRTPHTRWDSPVPTQTFVVDDETLQHYQSVYELLARAPGLDVVDGVRGQSIRLDGLDGKYTLVLIDGQRLGGRIDEAYDLRSIELDGVQRVEIIRGAGSALYGSDAIGGVINIITRTSVKHRVRVHRDTNGQKDALIGTGFQGESSSVSLDVYGNEDKPVQLNGSEATSFSGSKKFGTQIIPRYTGDNWDIKGRLQGSKETLTATELSPAGAILKRENKLTHSTIGIEPSLYLENEAELRFTLKQDQMEDDYTQKLRRTGAVQTEQETMERILESSLAYIKPIGSHLLNVGVQNIDEILESDRLLQDSVDRSRTALYIQDELVLLDRRFSIIPSIRQDYDTQYDNHTSKKISLRYSPDESQALMVSYGEGYRAPSFKELYLLFENTSVGYVVEGNDELTPESSRNVHLQYNLRDQGRWSIGIGAFHTVIKDLIEDVLLERDAAGQTHYSYENVSRAETAGADLSLALPMSDRLHFELGYGYLYARDLSRQVALLRRSKHSFSYELSFRMDRFTLANQVKWQSAREPNEKADLANDKAIVNGDLSLSYRQDLSWLYSIAIQNLGASAGDTYWLIPRRSLSFSLTWIPFT
ncbi:MAG: TonB-dependent receptor [Proteobacteria bacterium]|nr:MAG: TonB-dependent receptor [Pseudomonadota bacterium]